MAYLYIENRYSETPRYGPATENVPEGDLVTLTAAGAELADAGDHSHVGGIALNLEAGDNIADHEYDYATGIDQFVYKPAVNKDSDDMFPNKDDRPPVRGRIDGSGVCPRTTVESTAGTTAAPNIAEHAVVGVVDTSAADAPAAAGMIVEEGYVNNENGDTTSTTFSRSNGNFIPLGRAVAPVDNNKGDGAFPVTTFDTRVWVERDKSL